MLLFQPSKYKLPELPILSGDDTCRILQMHGFEMIRQRGSHMIMQKKIERGTITVPVPKHKELKRGTLRSIIRQSSLTVEDFLP